ncbi:MAG: chitobiase/beta-hexosaminidase C-terminal domain-containing protein [Fibrobacterota bacterium]|nr:MAG: chitobiase/beta-hexosaminidase C-terminal domain-containing protein [Fibrobacterota bacterium]
MKRFPLIPLCLALLAMGLSVSCNSDSATNSDGGDGTGTSSGVAAPTFSPAGGNYASIQSVTISSATEGATIYYTVSGSNPTKVASLLNFKYTGPINVNQRTTLKAIAVRNDISSAVSSVLYYIGGSTEAIPWNTSVTYGTLTDSRDGKSYKTVKIGTQTWMAENMNYKVDSSWCYANITDSCSRYGRLYQWAAAMGLDPSYNSKPWSETSPRQGICPSGWHVPSDAEWTTLQTFVDPARTSAAIKLRSSNGWLSTSDSTLDGTDTYGFRALPGGQSYADIFYTGGIYGYWWTATGNGGARAVSRFINYYQANLNYDQSKVDVGSTTLKTTEYSVRCIQD